MSEKVTPREAIASKKIVDGFISENIVKVISLPRSFDLVYLSVILLQLSQSLHTTNRVPLDLKVISHI